MNRDQNYDDTYISDWHFVYVIDRSGVGGYAVRVCVWFVRPSVCLSVRPSVPPSVYRSAYKAGNGDR